MTTNSITQSFSRRVIAGFLAEDGSLRSPSPPQPSPETGDGVGRAVPSATAPPPPLGEGRGGGREAQPSGNAGKLSLTLAIPDHPWTRATRDAAAVRIAMTVAEAGTRDGTLIEIVGEAGLDTDTPDLKETATPGRINADLTVGTDVTKVVPLRANERLCSPGVKLHGAGFIVTPQQAEVLGLGTRPGLEAHIRPYRNGRDLLGRSRGVMVIDLFGLSEKEVRDRFPEVYQHLLKTVKPERDENPRQSYRDSWWVFGEPRRDLRPALSGLTRYISTVESAARRIFHFTSVDILPDNKLIVFALEDGFSLGVLMSDIHISWWLSNAGMLGSYDRPAVYVKSSAFDPFPFPDPTPDQRQLIGTLAEELDLTRRVALDENPGLTMTGLYNMVAALRAGEAMTPAAEAAGVKARARIVQKLHTDLDTAVAAAYGWPANLTPTQIVTNLAALNAERAAEEKAGTIRWLRPDYQAKG